MNPDTIKRSLPPELAELIRDARWSEDAVGESEAHIFLLEVPGKPNRYLKVSPQALDEKLRLEWLHGQLPVPQVIYFGESGNNQYLLLSEISGWMAFDEAFRPNLKQLARLVASGLRDIHSIPIDNCPFDQRLDIKIEAARRRVREGLVEEAGFDAKRQGRTAQSLNHELLATRPDHEDLVFTHGDYCLPNIIIDPQKWCINGFIDWGRAGIADRYQDLALAARSFIRNFDLEWVTLLFKEYGIEAIDYKKLEFYQLLDEFF